MMYNGAWNGWMLAMMVIAPTVILIAVAAIVTLTRPAPARPIRRATASQVLDRRLAAGEIDAAEYRRVRDMLDNGKPTTREP